MKEELVDAIRPFEPSKRLRYVEPTALLRAAFGAVSANQKVMQLQVEPA